MNTRKLILFVVWVIVCLGLPSSPESLALMTGCALAIYFGLHLALQAHLLSR